MFNSTGFGAPVGQLTTHGREYASAVGAHYRAAYGLSRLSCAELRDAVFTYADDEERDRDTARELLDALAPGARGPERRYYCDAEGWVGAALRAALRHLPAAAGLPTEVLPLMRFLHYAAGGGGGAGLAAHVDLSRTWEGRKSTHTFILYLRGGEEGGGETVLLRGATGGEELASVAPQRGRVLVFPHMCPHLARAVRSPPKTLLRGEAW